MSKERSGAFLACAWHMRLARTPAPHVVVVEAQRDLLDTICFHFEIAGCRCTPVTDASTALRRICEPSVSLVIMNFATGRSIADWPDRLMKVMPPGTRLLLLADRRDDRQALAALERYADDYITKPIHILELVARGQALIRRTSGHDRTYRVPVASGELVFHPAEKKIESAGRQLHMTDQEFRLLYVLAGRAGTVFTRQDLLDIIWCGNASPTLRSVDALMKRVRRRLETLSHVGPLLRTVRGVGYKFIDHGRTHSGQRLRLVRGSGWRPAGAHEQLLRGGAISQ